MEDSPRVSGEENATDNTIDVDASLKKRRKTQDFLDRWHRFNGRDSDKSLSIPSKEKTEEITDDEEDEDDESDTLGTSAKKRFKRIRRNLKPFLPQTKRVAENPAQISSVEDVPKSKLETAEIIANDSSEPSKLEELPEDIGHVNDGSQQSAGQEYGINELEQHTDFDSSSIETESDIAVPELESIEDILRRREQEQDSVAFARNRSDVVPNGTVQPTTSELDTRQEVDVVPNKRIPTNSLLAVDLLNYRISKNRDNKNKKINQKELNQLKTEQDVINSGLDLRISKSEKQQTELNNKAEYNKKGIEQQVGNSSGNIIYNRKELSEKPFNIKNSEYNNVPYAHTETYKTNAESNKDHEKNTQRNFENTLQRVQEAEKSKILSEFQFERRHEVMDEPGGGKNYASINTSQVDLVQNSNLDATVKQTSNTQDLKNSSKYKEELHQSVYKQAAITGFWGAVAGVVVFIILYMLAS